MYLELGRGLDVVRVRSGDSPEIQRGGGGGLEAGRVSVTTPPPRLLSSSPETFTDLYCWLCCRAWADSASSLEGSAARLSLVSSTVKWG